MTYITKVQYVFECPIVGKFSLMNDLHTVYFLAKVFSVVPLTNSPLEFLSKTGTPRPRVPEAFQGSWCESHERAIHDSGGIERKGHFAMLSFFVYVKSWIPPLGTFAKYS